VHEGVEGQHPLKLELRELGVLRQDLGRVLVPPARDAGVEDRLGGQRGEDELEDPLPRRPVPVQDPDPFNVGLVAGGQVVFFS